MHQFSSRLSSRSPSSARFHASPSQLTPTPTPTYQSHPPTDPFTGRNHRTDRGRDRLHRRVRLSPARAVGLHRRVPVRFYATILLFCYMAILVYYDTTTLLRHCYYTIIYSTTRLPAARAVGLHWRVPVRRPTTAILLLNYCTTYYYITISLYCYTLLRLYLYTTGRPVRASRPGTRSSRPTTTRLHYYNTTLL